MPTETLAAMSRLDCQLTLGGCMWPCSVSGSLEHEQKVLQILNDAKAAPKLFERPLVAGHAESSKRNTTGRNALRLFVSQTSRPPICLRNAGPEKHAGKGSEPVSFAKLRVLQLGKRMEAL